MRRQFLKDNPDVRAALDSELRKALGMARKEAARPSATPVEPAKPVEASQAGRCQRCTFAVRDGCPIYQLPAAGHDRITRQAAIFQEVTMLESASSNLKRSLWAFLGGARSSGRHGMCLFGREADVAFALVRRNADRAHRAGSYRFTIGVTERFTNGPIRLSIFCSTACPGSCGATKWEYGSPRRSSAHWQLSRSIFSESVSSGRERRLRPRCYFA